jgi:uncharacterized protein (TIGR02118 family)
MHALVVLYPQPDDPEAFRDYYETRHVPLAAELPGLVTQSFGYPAALGPDPSPWFCIWRGEFESAAALEAALGSPVGQQVAADVPNNSPKGATLVHMALKG